MRHTLLLRVSALTASLSLAIGAGSAVLAAPAREPAAGAISTTAFHTERRVDGGDFLIWQRSQAAGDFDADGDVDGADFLVWQTTPRGAAVDAADLAIWRN